ncbi:MAG: arylsulfatase A-like enzyme [Candidatus Paceibacteria bacterium]|jgi:arylsulfatase A-like enzyme
MDTTNPGTLDVYGKDRGLTPNLASLAAEGVVFDRAHSVVAITLPSHISMMTGLYPLHHGVRDNGWSQLSGSAETLAERASEAGFETAAFVAAIVLAAPYGLDQGFDVYDEPADGGGGSISTMRERTSTAVTDQALEWLNSRDDERPFFLWVHYFDPHMPHVPGAEFAEQANGNLYHGEVATMDHDIGRLLNGLERSVGKQGFFVAVAADHGESLGRHGEPSHSAFAYQSTIHIPMLMRFPDGRRAGTRSDDVVSLVDLYPTFLEELQLGAAGDVDGLSLAAAPLPADRGVYVESYSGYLNYGWSPLAGWVDRNGKYLHSSSPEFYDLENDPAEEHNLIGVQELQLQPYRAALEQLSRRGALAATEGAALSEQALKDLRALGYASGGDAYGSLPAPLDASTRPAPRERASQYERFSRAVGLAQAGRNRPAIKLLRATLSENPGNIYAAETLAGCLLQEQEHEEVVVLLSGLLARGEERYKIRAFLATALENLGRLEEALEQYRMAQVQRPTEPTIQAAIERTQSKLGVDGSNSSQ